MYVLYDNYMYVWVMWISGVFGYKPKARQRQGKSGQVKCTFFLHVLLVFGWLVSGQMDKRWAGQMEM